MVRKAASVRFVNVTKNYGAVAAVREISFTIEPGTLVTLLGPSGCGKTTTLRLIAGLEMPSAGQIFIADKEVSSLPATSRDVTMVFQSYALFPHMTVIENVAYGLKVSGVVKQQAIEKAEHGLKMVGLTGFGARLPSELSGGQQQRVAVARAVIANPKVILADEPTGNLDSSHGDEVMKILVDLNEKGTTIVMVTHSPAYADYANRVIHLFDGHVVTENLKEKYDRHMRPLSEVAS